VFLFLSAALAQHVDLDHGDVLTPGDLPFEADAIGHPSLSWDADRQRFVLLFEATTWADGCDEAFEVGRAESADGLTWTIDRNRMGPTDAHPCGVRRPAAAATSDGVAVALEDAATGEILVVRRHREAANQRWAAEGLEGLSQLSIARRDGGWVAAAVDPDEGLVFATSDDLVSWSVAPGTGLDLASTWWSADAILSPSLSCYDGESFPWVMHYGGAAGDEVGFTWGSSDDLTTWFLSLAADVRDAPDHWQAWDAVASPSAAWVVYAHDGSLGFATTDETLPGDDVATRDCAP